MGTTFGFSAFIKLISLNQRPRITEMRKRLGPSTGSGYDFHKLTRELLHQLFVDGILADELIAKAELIKNPYEKRSAIEAINKLVQLRTSFEGRPFDLPEVTYESPAGVFKVKLRPDFGTVVSGTRVGIHLWNTKEPRVDARLASAALSLFGHRFAEQTDDLAVLDLRRAVLIRMGAPGRHAVLADRMVSYLEETFLDIRDGRTIRPGLEDRLRPS